MKTKSILMFAAVVLAATVVFGSETATTNIKKQTIKIGVVLPLSSSVGSAGESARDGLMLKMAQIPGDTKFDYKIFVEDDGYIPRQSMLAVQRLISVEKVDVLFTLWGPGTDAAIPILKRNGSRVLHISPTRWQKPPDYPWDFALSGSAENYAQKAAELLQALNLKKVALFAAQDRADEYMFSFLLPKLKEAKIEVADLFEANEDVRDFRPWIMRLKEKQPQAVLQNVYMPGAEIALRQMRELGLETLNIGIGNFFTEVRPELVEGACYILQSPDKADFVKAYERRYHHAPLYPAANYYDALGLVVRAAELLPAEPKPSAETLAGAMRGIKSYEGAMGAIHFVPPNKLECDLYYYLIQNGKHKIVSAAELAEFYKIKIKETEKWK